MSYMLGGLLSGLGEGVQKAGVMVEERRIAALKKAHEDRLTAFSEESKNMRSQFEQGEANWRNDQDNRSQNARAELGARATMGAAKLRATTSLDIAEMNEAGESERFNTRLEFDKWVEKNKPIHQQNLVRLREQLRAEAQAAGDDRAMQRTEKALQGITRTFITIGPGGEQIVRGMDKTGTWRDIMALPKGWRFNGTDEDDDDLDFED